MKQDKSAGDLLLEVVDPFLEHGYACGEAECDECVRLINRVRVAHKVWQSSEYKRVSAAERPAPSNRSVATTAPEHPNERPAQTCATCRFWTHACILGVGCRWGGDLKDQLETFGCTLHEPVPPGQVAQE